MSEPFLSIIIPAYNEAQRIGGSLEKVRQYIQTKPFTTQLIAVDDGSTDGTADLLQAASKNFPSMRVLRNDSNCGKGFSVRRGVLEAQGSFALFTDADLSAPIEETDKLLDAIQASRADAAVGSRGLRQELVGTRQPWFRELGGRLFNRLVRLLTGLKLTDTQCGLKLFRRESTRRAFNLQRTRRFGFDPELLFLIERLGGHVVEVPVRWDNNPATKVRLLRDASQMFWDLIALRWRWWRGEYSAGADFS